MYITTCTCTKEIRFFVAEAVFPSSQLGPLLSYTFDLACHNHDYYNKLTSCLGFRATAFVAVSLSLEMLVERVLIVCITTEESTTHKFCICIWSSMYTNVHWAVYACVQVTYNVYTYVHCVHALTLFPGPRPASHHLQYGKAGEGLVHFLTWVTSRVERR